MVTVYNDFSEAFRIIICDAKYFRKIIQSFHLLPVFALSSKSVRTFALFCMPSLWNSLPSALRDNSLSQNTLKRKSKTQLSCPSHTNTRTQARACLTGRLCSLLDRCTTATTHATCNQRACELQEKHSTSTRTVARNPARLAQFLQTSLA